VSLAHCPSLSRLTGEGTAGPFVCSFLKRLDPQSREARFSLSHPMGEGRGEGSEPQNPNRPAQEC